MAVRDERRQPFLEREPVALGALARHKIKKALAEQTAGAVTQTDIDNTVDSGIAAHLAAADPHTQYVANDPALRT